MPLAERPRVRVRRCSCRSSPASANPTCRTGSRGSTTSRTSSWNCSTNSDSTACTWPGIRWAGGSPWNLPSVIRSAFQRLRWSRSAGIHVNGVPKGDLFMRAPDVVLRSMFADSALGRRAGREGALLAGSRVRVQQESKRRRARRVAAAALQSTAREVAASRQHAGARDLGRHRSPVSDCIRARFCGIAPRRADHDPRRLRSLRAHRAARTPPPRDQFLIRRGSSDEVLLLSLDAVRAARSGNSRALRFRLDGIAEFGLRPGGGPRALQPLSRRTRVDGRTRFRRRRPQRTPHDRVRPHAVAEPHCRDARAPNEAHQDRDPRERDAAARPPADGCRRTGDARQYHGRPAH